MGRVVLIFLLLAMGVNASASVHKKRFYIITTYTAKDAMHEYIALRQKDLSDKSIELKYVDDFSSVIGSVDELFFAGKACRSFLYTLGPKDTGGGLASLLSLLIDGVNDFKKVMNSDIKGVKTYMNKLKEKSFVMINGSTYFASPLYITSNEKIVKPSDLKGKKLRYFVSSGGSSVYRELGAKISYIQFSDLYLSLKSGIVNTEINSIGSIMSGKLYEVQKYVLDVPVSIGIVVFMCKQTGLYAEMSPNDREVINDIYRHLATVMNEYSSEYDLQLLKSKGMTVVHGNKKEWAAAFEDYNRKELERYTDNPNFYDDVKKFLNK